MTDLKIITDVANTMRYTTAGSKLSSQVSEGSVDAGVVLEDSKGMSLYISYEADSTKQAIEKAKAVADYIQAVNPDVVAELIKEIERLKPFEAEAKRWKANHDHQVDRARVLVERTDMPLERVNAYNRMVALERENISVKAEIESLKDERYTRQMLDMIFSQVINTSRDTQGIKETIDRVFRR